MRKERSEGSHAVLDKESRTLKARKILSVLESNTSVKGRHILDIGTGAGYIAQELSSEGAQVCSIDIVDERKVKNGYQFKLTDSVSIPYPNNYFDIVITNHVIEHIADQEGHLTEIHRVLKQNGIVYLATPNKNWFFDYHYRVLFINWMPRKLASLYLQKVRGKEWDVYPIKIGDINRIIHSRFRLRPVMGDILKNPQKYYLSIPAAFTKILKVLPTKLLDRISVIIPTIIVIMVKQD